MCLPCRNRRWKWAKVEKWISLHDGEVSCEKMQIFQATPTCLVSVKCVVVERQFREKAGGGGIFTSARWEAARMWVRSRYVHARGPEYVRKDRGSAFNLIEKPFPGSISTEKCWYPFLQGRKIYNSWKAECGITFGIDYFGTNKIVIRKHHHGEWIWRERKKKLAKTSHLNTDSHQIFIGPGNS